MPAPETQSTEDMKDLAQIPRCANYVSSENKSINDTLLIKTQTVEVRGRLQVVIISISKFVWLIAVLVLIVYFHVIFEYSESIFSYF